MSPTPNYCLFLLIISNFAILLSTCTEVNALGWGQSQQQHQPAPSESECRPYIEKALKEQLGDTPQESTAEVVTIDNVDSKEETEESPANETSSQEGSIEITEPSDETADSTEATVSEESNEDGKDELKEENVQAEQPSTDGDSEEEGEKGESEDGEEPDSIEKGEETLTEHKEDITDSSETAESVEAEGAKGETVESEETQEKSKEDEDDKVDSAEDAQGQTESTEEKVAEADKSDDDDDDDDDNKESVEDQTDSAEDQVQSAEKQDKSVEDQSESAEENIESTDATEKKPESVEASSDKTESDEQATESAEEETSKPNESVEETAEDSIESTEDTASDEVQKDETKTKDDSESGEKSKEAGEQKVATDDSKESTEDAKPDEESKEEADEKDTESGEKDAVNTSLEEESKEEEQEMSEEGNPEEDLTLDVIIPEKLRSREHLAEILHLGDDEADTEQMLSKTIDITLRELKRLYDNAIKPLEMLYKYRDLSNRHFGDPEIFSKPLVLFMGPWSGGKSSIINYLLDNEYKKTALRTGAEPSPAYFNILMYGDEPEVLDGTQLAADWTFSGLQKFGQGLLDRLRGLKLKQPLLEKVNIVEIPGILEIRKQVERMFPFNDACQWFIDRADIIFLVYDPAKLDVGPETEAILDQLKGREYQTRIILNKADQVKPEELMRVQGTLIWNISPLMSSPEPPLIYSTSLWSLPYEKGSPTRLLYAQERAFLRDLREAIDKRVDNKIASARRFAVRVRNHAKMVDCYLTTFYNHKSFFGNKKKIADDIIERPQNYHIYEGLSTLTNISRYDLPDPEVYRDFFRLNPVYEFQQLSATCTYFRGCPINRLDIAIAYDLPELVGKYKKSVEHVLTAAAAQKPKS